MFGPAAVCIRPPRIIFLSGTASLRICQVVKLGVKISFLQTSTYISSYQYHSTSHISSALMASAYACCFLSLRTFKYIMTDEVHSVPTVCWTLTHFHNTSPKYKSEIDFLIILSVKVSDYILAPGTLALFNVFVPDFKYMYEFVTTCKDPGWKYFYGSNAVRIDDHTCQIDEILT